MVAFLVCNFCFSKTINRHSFAEVLFQLGAPSDFDHYAILASFHRPPDALGRRYGLSGVEPRYYANKNHKNTLFCYVHPLQL